MGVEDMGVDQNFSKSFRVAKKKEVKVPICVTLILIPAIFLYTQDRSKEILI